MPLIKVLNLIFLVLLVMAAGCSNDTSMFESVISKPTVFIKFDQNEYEFDITKINTTSEATITLDTEGGVPVEQIQVSIPEPFRFKGGTYPGTGGTCGNTITSSCSILVEFAPTTHGNYEEDIVFTYWTGKAFESKNRTLKGDTNAGLSLTVGSHNFSRKVLTTVTTQVFTVTHIGGTTATALTTPQVSAPFWISASTCSTSISNGQSCTITVSFIPLAISLYSEDLEISFHDYFDNVTLASNLTGEGIPPAVLSISNATTHDFGLKANTSATALVYTVSYASGAVPGTNITISTNPTAPYSMTSAACNGGSIDTGQTCTYTVTFSPTVTGIHSGSFSLSYHDGATTQTIVKNFTGESKKQAIVSISPISPQNFGTLNSGQTSDIALTLTYDATSFFPATSLAVSGLSSPINFAGGTYPGTGGTCGTSLSSGTCTIVVRFSPVVAGVFSKTMAITYHNGASTQTISMVLNGRSEAKINPSVASVSFANTTENSSRDFSLTLTNAGGATASLLSASSLTLPFKYKGGTYPGTGGTCGVSINSLASCIVVLNFSPTSSITSNDTFSLSYNDGYNAQTLNVPLSGTGITPGVLNLGLDVDFGQKINGSTTELSVTVTKTGQSTATSAIFSLTGTSFSYKGGTFPGTGGTCTDTISANCTILITFQPIISNSYSGTLSVNYNNGHAASSDDKVLSGSSVSPATLAFLPTSFNFGTQTIGSTTETTINISNSGSTTATTITPSISAPFSFKDGSYPGTGGDCDSDLSPAEACSVVIVYEPTTVDGDNSNASFQYNNGLATITGSVPLSGLGEVVMGSMMQLRVIQPSIISDEGEQQSESLEKISSENKWNQLSSQDTFIRSRFDEIEIRKRHEKEIIIPKENEVETEGLRLIKFSDWDTDGHPDFMATRIHDGLSEIRILSGKTGLELDFRVLPEHSNPLGVHRVGDMNNDKIDDYFVGIYQKKGKKYFLKGLKCMDGLSGDEIFEVQKK